MSKSNTVRQFMLKKYPTNKYMDCPVPQHHWPVIQEYSDQQNAKLRETFLQLLNAHALNDRHRDEWLEQSGLKEKE